jgi:hypothetical protein
VRPVPVPRTLLYFIGLAIPASLTALAVALAESPLKITGLKAVMEVVPFSSFLLGLNERPSGEVTYVAQGILALGVLLAAGWRSRDYWRKLKSFEAQDREPAGPATGLS